MKFETYGTKNQEVLLIAYFLYLFAEYPIDKPSWFCPICLIFHMDSSFTIWQLLFEYKLLARKKFYL